MTPRQCGKRHATVASLIITGNGILPVHCECRLTFTIDVLRYCYVVAIQYTSLHVRIAISASTMHYFYTGQNPLFYQHADNPSATGCATWYIPANEPQILELEHLKPTSKTISTWKMTTADTLHVTSSGAIFAECGQNKSNSCLPSLNSWKVNTFYRVVYTIN